MVELQVGRGWQGGGVGGFGELVGYVQVSVHLGPHLVPVAACGFVTFPHNPTGRVLTKCSQLQVHYHLGTLCHM